MHHKEFVWFVLKDDNRVSDGRELRWHFLLEKGEPKGITRWDFGPVSVLEVLIALSRRVEWAAEGYAETWAWQLLENLELTEMSDPLSHRKAQQVDEILERLIWRTYSPDGTGGFFPLLHPPKDQTKTEIWNQMNRYVIENTYPGRFNRKEV